MICTAKPTVGGVARRSAWGSTTWRMRCQRVRPRHSAASHWLLCTAWIQPRQISPRKALA